MRIRNIITTGLLAFLILALHFETVNAQSVYTAADLAQHNTMASCWMSFEGKVYDITTYLDEHDSRYYDIKSWCGRDMTEAFITKDGQGADHKRSSYSLLEDYYIGALTTATVAPVATAEATPAITQTSPAPLSTTTQPAGSISLNTVKAPANPYNFGIPFILTCVILLGTYLLMKAGKLMRAKMNFIWNTALLLSIVPSVLFGLYLVLRYSFPELKNVSFDFLYWHVEGSIVFATIVLGHIILRLKQYVAPLILFKKDPAGTVTA